MQNSLNNVKMPAKAAKRKTRFEDNQNTEKSTCSSLSRLDAETSSLNSGQIDEKY